MKTTITLCVALLAGGAALNAAESPVETEATYALTADFPYVTKYVFRGLQIARDSIQPSLELTAGSMYMGAWSNIPLRSEHDGNVSKELDLYLGYTPKLTDEISADIGLTYYSYPNVKSPSKKGTTETFAGATMTVGNFTPAIYFYRDIDLDIWTVQGSVGYSVPLKSWGTSLDFNATLGSVNPDHGENYTYYSVGVTAPVKLSDRVKLNFGVTYSANDISGGKDPGLWGTAGITASF